MNKGKNAQTLQWFTDFASLDLERIGRGDRAKLLVESDHLWPGEELKAFDPLGTLTPKRLRDLSWALEIPPKESPEYWSAIVRAQKSILALFAHLQITAHPSPEVADAPSAAVTHVIRGQDEVLWLLEKGPGVPYTLTFLPVTKTQEDYLQLKIPRLLEGFSQHAIMRCPGCGRWFFNPTKHEKRFCSDRCIWKTNAAKRRAAAKEKSGA